MKPQLPATLRELPPLSKYFWRVAGQQTLNLFFPPVCAACQKPVREAHALCHSCFNAVRFTSAPACGRCGHPFEYAAGDDALCGSCLDELPVYEKGWSCFGYDEHTRYLLTRLKFRDRTDLAPLLGRLMVSHGAPVIDGMELVVPVPLHRRRLLKRRYNQSLLLARKVAKAKGISLLPDALVRLRHTAPQTGLSRAERQSNVARAFAVAAQHEAHIRGKKILLIDDVMTTGATLSACAKALQKAGADTVHILTAARRLAQE